MLEFEVQVRRNQFGTIVLTATDEDDAASQATRLLATDQDRTAWEAAPPDEVEVVEVNPV